MNILDNNGASPVHWAVFGLWDNIEGLKLLLKHSGLSALTLNKKDEEYCKTPVMLAVSLDRLEFVALLAADLRVDLDTTDMWGKSLEELARWAFLVAFLFSSQHHVI